MAGVTDLLALLQGCDGRILLAQALAGLPAQALLLRQRLLQALHFGTLLLQCLPGLAQAGLRGRRVDAVGRGNGRLHADQRKQDRQTRNDAQCGPPWRHVRGTVQ